MQQNPQEPTPDQNHCLPRLVRILNHSIVKTAIATSIVALSGGLGFVNCLNKNDAKRDTCLNNEVPLAIGFAVVGMVAANVIFNCIREYNQSAQAQGENPNSSFAPPFGFGNINRVLPLGRE